MTPGVGTTVHYDFDKMVLSMTDKLNSFLALLETAEESSISQIYRVPQHIRELDSTAYEPFVLSIGPYHHGSHHLQDMDKVKLEHLDHILKLNCGVNLHDYLRGIANLEKLARACYSADVAMDRKSFLRMLLLDGSFILITIDENIDRRPGEDEVSLGTASQVIRSNLEVPTTLALADIGGTSGTESKCVQDMSPIEVEITEVRPKQSMECNWKHEEDGKVSDEHRKIGDWYSQSAWHDIFLLENQIPFFIVEKIYQLAMGKRVSLSPIADKACKCVQDVLCHYPTAMQESDRPNNIHHLLNLCHTYLRPTQKPYDDREFQAKQSYFYRLLHIWRRYFHFGQKQEIVQSRLPMQHLDCFQAGELPIRWRRAQHYHEAGVTIIKREWSSYSRHSLLDIKFSNGVIEVPFFPVDESTESLFKNLTAFEQIDPRFGNDITAYVVFMSEFINTPADATLLTKNGIIVHMLESDDELPAIFNRLSKQVSFTFGSHYYLKPLCRALEAHYQSRLNRWIAWLWLNHFSNPWLALGMFAAVIVLLCTVVQTIYTVLAYVKPSS